MRKVGREFLEFINRGNVVTFAVGVVMALFFQEIIQALIDGVVMPVVAAVVGEPNYQDIGFDLGDSFVSIGLVINAVIVFLVVALLLFGVVKVYTRYLGREDAPPTDIELLTEIRDELRSLKPGAQAEGGNEPA